MAFVKDKPTKEEIKKYDLDGLWNRYHRGANISLPESFFEHVWTIDKEREIWLYDMTHYHQKWSGELYLFHYNGRIMEMGVKRDSNDSLLLDLHFTKEVIYLEEEERSEDYTYPFEYGVRENFIDEESLKEINTVFKEALTFCLTDKSNCQNYTFNCRW